MHLNNDKDVKVIYVCPTVPIVSCHWEGNALDILEHVLDAHSNFLLNSNTFSIDLVEDTEKRYILATDGGLFLVQTQIDLVNMTMHVKLRYLAYDNSSEDFLRYGIEASCNSVGFTNENSSENYNPVYNTTNGVDVDLATIEVITGRKTQHILIKVNLYTDSNEPLNCLTLKQLQSDRIITEDNSVCVNTLSGLFLESDEEVNNDCFYCETDCVDCEDFNGTDKPIQAVNSNFISEDSLQCSNCKCTMIPPIHVCPNNHNVCYSCRSGVCSICDEPITSCRNIPLEDHSKTSQHRCRYEPQGCQTMCTYSEIRKHELECIYCIYKCELCSFKSTLPEIGTHYRIAHPSTKIYETMSGIHFRKGSNFIILNSLGVFYCTSSATDIYIKWEVIYCGPKERFFSCEVKVSGKKPHHPTKHYFLKRIGNCYTWTVSWDELKTAGVKEKYATLYVVGY